ncbi:MAG: YdhR family protein [Gaiellaceae bacterium]
MPTILQIDDDEASARAYLEEHTGLLEGFGIGDNRARVFDVNEPLTDVTRGPLG